MEVDTNPTEVEVNSDPVEEFEYEGPDGEFGTADEATVDEFEVDEDDEEWGL